MKIIVTIPYYVKGGVERVIISLMSNLYQYVEKIIILVNAKEISYFKSLLPDSEKIVYEPFQWTKASVFGTFVLAENKVFNILNKLKRGLFKLPKPAKKIRNQYRLNYLINKYEADCCLYIITNRVEVPPISIPLTSISYDLFWRFAPLTYSDSYMADYDNSLLMWLEKSNLIFTISEKTRDDIISIFPNPEFKSKLKAIPLSGYSTNSTGFSSSMLPPSEDIIRFYFPSSFGIYKDHLTLLKAAIQLGRKNLNFKVILIGKETDNFVNGKLDLSKQSETKEYNDYLNQWRQVYEENTSIIQKYVEGLGYCDYSTLEYWYENCSCVIMPSQYEGFGLAVSEAIVRGLPVISSDLEVLKEQAELYKCHDRVDFFPKGDANALANLMEYFIQNPNPKLDSEESKARFSHWTWDDVALTYLNSLKELTKSK